MRLPPSSTHFARLRSRLVDNTTAKPATANGIGSHTDRVSAAPAAASPPQTAGCQRGDGLARESSGRTHSATPHRLSVASRANRLSLSSITPKAIASGLTAASHAAAAPTRNPATAVPSRPVAQTASVASSTTASRETSHLPYPGARTENSRTSAATGPASVSGNSGGRIARRGNLDVPPAS